MKKENRYACIMFIVCMFTTIISFSEEKPMATQDKHIMYHRLGELILEKKRITSDYEQAM